MKNEMLSDFESVAAGAEGLGMSGDRQTVTLDRIEISLTMPLEKPEFNDVASWSSVPDWGRTPVWEAFLANSISICKHPSHN